MSREQINPTDKIPYEDLLALLITSESEDETRLIQTLMAQRLNHPLPSRLVQGAINWDALTQSEKTHIQSCFDCCQFVSDLLLESLRCTDSQRQISAAQTLGKIGRPDIPGVVETLIVALEDNPEPFVRMAATQALGQLGSTTQEFEQPNSVTKEEIIKTLTEARGFDPDTDVRETAKEALLLLGKPDDEDLPKEEQENQPLYPPVPPDIKTRRFLLTGTVVLLLFALALIIIQLPNSQPVVPVNQNTAQTQKPVQPATKQERPLESTAVPSPEPGPDQGKGPAEIVNSTHPPSKPTPVIQKPVTTSPDIFIDDPQTFLTSHIHPDAQGDSDLVEIVAELKKLGSPKPPDVSAMPITGDVNLNITSGSSADGEEKEYSLRIAIKKNDGSLGDSETFKFTFSRKKDNPKEIARGIFKNIKAHLVSLNNAKQ